MSWLSKAIATELPWLWRHVSSPHHIIIIIIIIINFIVIDITIIVVASAGVTRDSRGGEIDKQFFPYRNVTRR